MIVALWINQALVDVALGVLIWLAVKTVRQGNWIKLTMTPWMKSIHDLLAPADPNDALCRFVHPPPPPGMAEQAEAIRAGLVDWVRNAWPGVPNRPTPPPEPPIPPLMQQPKKQPCKGFRWIGSFKCDGCGLPFWEHTHDTLIKPGAGPFDDDPFVYVPISDETKARVKAKWGKDVIQK